MAWMLRDPSQNLNRPSVLNTVKCFISCFMSPPPPTFRGHYTVFPLLDGTFFVSLAVEDHAFVSNM